jgi:hypothetical protein
MGLEVEMLDAPRTLGVDVKLVLSGGREQVGVK